MGGARLRARDAAVVQPHPSCAPEEARALTRGGDCTRAIGNRGYCAAGTDATGATRDDKHTQEVAAAVGAVALRTDRDARHRRAHVRGARAAGERCVRVDDAVRHVRGRPGLHSLRRSRWISAGTAVLVWEGSSGYERQHRRRRMQASRRQLCRRPTRCPLRTPTRTRPQVAVDQSGNAIAIWQRQAGEEVVQAALRARRRRFRRSRDDLSDGRCERIATAALR